MMKKLGSKHGFTLVELTVALAIMAILSVIAMQTFGAVKEKGKLRQVETSIMEIDDALTNYGMEHGGKYPGLKEMPFAVGAWILSGPAIIGGNGGIPGEPNIRNQDDFLDDMREPDSPYRNLPGQNPTGTPRQKMKPVDELYREGIYRYKQNPYKDNGYAMVNVAYIEYEYDPTTNDYGWVNNIDGLGYIGLAPGVPDVNVAASQVYRVLDPATELWDPWDTTTYLNYPSGDFAYIPLSFTTEKGKYCEGYWLIGYGDKNTLVDSPYNAMLQNDPNWPNFDPPFGDGDATTPPAGGSFEDSVRRLMMGALVVRANIYEDQLSGLI